MLLSESALFVTFQLSAHAPTAMQEKRCCKVDCGKDGDLTALIMERSGEG